MDVSLSNYIIIMHAQSPRGYTVYSWPKHIIPRVTESPYSPGAFVILYVMLLVVIIVEAAAAYVEKLIVYYYLFQGKTKITADCSFTLYKGGTHSKCHYHL